MARERSLLSQLDAAVAKLRALDAELIGSLRESESLGALERVGDARRLIDAIGTRLAGAVARSDEGVVGESIAHRMGEKNAAALVALTARIELSEARTWCTVGARILPRESFLGEVLHPENHEVASALADGAIGVAAARLITDALHELRGVLDQESLHGIEHQLVDHARVLTLRDLARLCCTLPEMFQPDDAVLREERLRAKSGLTISRTPDGLVEWRIRMHPEAAGFVQTALDARTAPRREVSFRDETSEPNEAVDDDRTLAQKRLDAFVSIARESLAHDPGQVAGSAVTMVVTVSLDALRSGIGSAHIDGIDEPISARTARRLAADAEIIPMVLGTDSEPLDLGRTARLFSQAQRRFIGNRDGGCAWFGCTAPPGWCEIAHIMAWIIGGETNVDNAIMLCPFHHRRFDNDGWQLIERYGERWFVPPPWIDAAQTPRRAGRTPQLVA